MRPPCPAAISRAMNSPSPRLVHGRPCWSGTTASCTSGSKIALNEAGGITEPVLRTFSTRSDAVPSARRSIGSPGPRYCTALLSRFESSCCTRSPSKRPCRSPSRASSNRQSGCATATSSNDQRQTSPRSPSRGRIGRLPPSWLRAYSSRSLTMAVMVAALRRTRAPTSRVWVSSRPRRARYSPAMAMVLNGLRRSWPRMARKVSRLREERSV